MAKYGAWTKYLLELLKEVLGAISHTYVGVHLQVHIVKLKLLETGIDGLRNVGDIGDNLSRHDKFLSRYPALFDCLAQVLLGLVDFSSIEVVIS